MQASELIYNWNIDTTSKPVKLCDETLRDGLQGFRNLLKTLIDHELEI